MPEQRLPAGINEQLGKENLDPRHFYAAYVFDNAATRRRDVSVLMHETQHLGYPVRYWWLSEAMELQGSPDRLIVCVHHPSLGEDAGMDLYNVLSQAEQKHRAHWDDLEAAHVDEYRQFGKIIHRLDSIFEPDGTPLFPEVVSDNLPGALDWIGAVETTIKVGQAAGKIGPAVEEHKKEELEDLEERVRQFPGSGWAECYDGNAGHQCNAIHVSEGIDDEGQLYVRREWASSKFGLVEMKPPDDFTPHGWGPAYVPESSDTLEEVLTHLDHLVEDGILTSEERGRSDTYYKRLFQKNKLRLDPYEGETPYGITLDGGYGDID